MPPDLIIFDCDGVLIDSEGIASEVVAQDLTALGWPMSAAEAMTLFVGMNLTNMVPMIEARLGRPLHHAWVQELAAKLVAGMQAGARLIEGADKLLHEVTARGIPWRVASNSSTNELDAKFTRTGLMGLTKGRCFSATDILARGGRPKPAPDLYLAAAQDAGIPPARCVVLEDSPLGVRGAVAAGMLCYGFAPHGEAAPLLAEGAKEVFTALDQFAGVLS
ncbi:HAD family phosphatase [Acidocella sp.]|uniref:HAD family hydrolase n=1 Tax=Acidocella sp. TaxID=50710 RepID=UPI00260C073D|nr:HAD-IA family hydrolase [Acidocella sp.]